MDLIFLYTADNPSSVYAAQELETLLKEPDLEKTFQLTKIDLSADKETAEKFSVTALPASVFIKNNQEVGRINGYYPLHELRTKIKTILAARQG